MIIILMFLLEFISIACFFEGKTERKGLKMILSTALAITLPLIMNAAMYSLSEHSSLRDMPLLFLYYALPIIMFTTFQLLLFEIKIFE